VVDLDVFKTGAITGQLFQRMRQLAVDRLLAQTAYEYRDLVLAHGDLTANGAHRLASGGFGWGEGLHPSPHPPLRPPALALAQGRSLACEPVVRKQAASPREGRGALKLQLHEL